MNQRLIKSTTIFSVEQLSEFRGPIPFVDFEKDVCSEEVKFPVLPDADYTFDCHINPEVARKFLGMDLASAPDIAIEATVSPNGLSGMDI